METDLISQLPRNGLFYLACRVAFVRLLDLLLQEFTEPDVLQERGGYLDRVPLLKGTALHVQLERLLKTWQILRCGESSELTLEEQVICFAVTDELTEVAESNDRSLLRRASQGPRRVDEGPLLWLPSRVRLLQITLPLVPQAAVLQVESGIAADDLLSVRCAGGAAEEDLDALLGLLGRWRVSSRLFHDAEGLLTHDELDIVSGLFREQPGLILN